MHVAIAEIAAEAEAIAMGVPLSPSSSLSLARQRVRAALEGDGVAGRLEPLVQQVLKEVTNQ